ncbi:MAG: glycosyltransferase [Bacteroidales bacterium]|nr:glycosyltransferase [Bacteroidales bacterium]
MKTKRLCLVIPSLQAGGMERVMSELSWYFSTKKDIELNLVLYGKTREIFYSIPDDVIIHKPSFRFNNRWRFYYTLKTLLFLRKIFINVNPATILSFGEYWNNFVLISLMGLRYPVFVSDRSQPDKSLGRFHNKLRQWLYPQAKGIILQTEKAREIFLRANKHKNIAVIGNPIREIKKGKGPVKKEKHILMVGRLIKSKHQDKLIEMFAEVSPPDWKLLIVGYDHLKQQNMDRLKKLAWDLNASDRVIFMGKQEHIEEIYLVSSIFAFTSSSEGFPNAIGEAMSAGLPVVAYDCVAGPSEMIIDNHNGFLVPLFDDGQFRQKLKLLMENEALRNRLGKNAIEDIRKFSIEEIGEKYLKFIMKNHA